MRAMNEAACSGPNAFSKDIAGINGAALVDNLLRYAQPIKIFYGFLHLLLGEAVHFAISRKAVQLLPLSKFINVEARCAPREMMMTAARCKAVSLLFVAKSIVLPQHGADKFAVI